MVDFDPAKEAKNVRKHGISLTRFDAMTGRVFIFDEAHSDDELRYQVVGVIDGRVWLAVITYRNGEERIISLRPASRRERRHYEASQARPR